MLTYRPSKLHETISVPSRLNCTAVTGSGHARKHEMCERQVCQKELQPLQSKTARLLVWYVHVPFDTNKGGGGAKGHLSALEARGGICHS